MKNRIDDSQMQNNTPSMKAVTLMLPAHIADLIEATRGQLVGQWEDWAVTAAEQALDSQSFEACRREFESLLVDSNWQFDDCEGRAQFMEPLLKALTVAYAQHHATDEGIAPALMN